jgi:hypothetical protein
MKEQQECNILIALELLDYLMDNPELRFVQALWALGIDDGSDLFFETSMKTLKKVRERKELGKTERRFHETSQKVKKAT